jgi:phage terminase large subunit-like protein
MQKLTDEMIVRVIRAIAIVAVSHAALRRLFGQQSIIFFAWYYLGITLAPHQARWAKDMLKSQKHLFIAPVGHGKSETTKVIAIREVAYNWNIRILILSKKGKTEGVATKQLIVIKAEFKENVRLIRDFGRFYSPRNVWQQNKITVIRTMKHKDCTIEAVGMLEAVTGGRYDLIIGDDIIDELMVYEAKQRDKTGNYFFGTIMTRLTPAGRALIIGTMKHHDDIYNRLMKTPGWKVTIDKAIIREPADYEIIPLPKPIIDKDGHEQTHQVVIHGDDRGECLWDDPTLPDAWTMERLLLKRFGTPRPIWNREYQSTIVDDATALFPRANLEKCLNHNMGYHFGEIPDVVRDLYRVIVVGIDPSLITSKKEAEQAEGDYFAAVIIGLRHGSGDRDILAQFRERGLSPDAVMNKVESIYNNAKPGYCFIEVNSFGEIHHWNLVHKKGMKILPHRTGKNKHDSYEGVPALSPLFENGMIHLPYRTEADQAMTDILTNELHGLGTEKHDDMVMALWIAERGVQRYLAGQANLQKLRERAEKG